MIADYRSKVIYVTPPRTASRSLHRWLCLHPKHHAVWVVGPSFPGQGIDHHTVHAPADTEGFHWVLINRDLFTQLQSRYRCLCEYLSSQNSDIPTMAEFLTRIEADDPSLHPMYRKTPIDYAALAEEHGVKWAGAIDHEQLAEQVPKWSPWADPKYLEHIR